jgi:hypothetical protein
MMKEMLDANEAKEDTRLKEIKDEIKEDMKANKKSYREDLLARFEAKIDANQTNQTKTEDNQERMDVNVKEMREDIKSGREEMKSTVGAWIANVRDNQRERTPCQETTEAHLECKESTLADMKACQETTKADTEKNEPDPGMMQSIEVHQEIAKEEAAVMLVGGLRKRRRVRNLAA